MQLKADHPGRVIVIEYHDKEQFKDIMYSQAQEEYTTFLSTQPQYIVPSFISMRENGIWIIKPPAVQMFALSGLDEPTPAHISIKHTWNVNQRKITGTIDIMFDSIPDSGNFAVGILVTENNVQGGDDYNQRSYFSDLDLYPELKGKGKTIKGFKHMNVFRDTIMGSPFGKPSSIPSIPELHKIYSIPFDYTVPKKYIDLEVRISQLKIVAFIGYYKGPILNADEKHIDSSTSVLPKNKDHTLPNFIKVYTEKAGNKIIHITSRKVPQVTLYSSQGRKLTSMQPIFLVKQRVFKVVFDQKKHPPGIYFLAIVTKNVKYTLSMIIP